MKKSFFSLLVFLLAAHLVKAQGSDLIGIDCSKLINDYYLVIKAPDGSIARAATNSISISDSHQFQVDIYKVKGIVPAEDKAAVMQSKTLQFKQMELEDSKGFIYEAVAGKTSSSHFHFYAVFKTGTYLITDHEGSSYPLEKIKIMYELLKLAEEK